MLGRVVEVILGFDNIIRSVRVKQGNGQIVLHPICNLYPLELTITHSGEKQSKENSEFPVQPSTPNNVTNLVPVPGPSGLCNQVPAPGSSGQSNYISKLSDKLNKRPVRKAAKKFRKFLRENLDDL